MAGNVSRSHSCASLGPRPCICIREPCSAEPHEARLHHAGLARKGSSIRVFLSSQAGVDFCMRRAGPTVGAGNQTSRTCIHKCRSRLVPGAKLGVVFGMHWHTQKKSKTCRKHIGIRAKLFIPLKLGDNYCIRLQTCVKRISLQIFFQLRHWLVQTNKHTFLFVQLQAACCLPPIPAFVLFSHGSRVLCFFLSKLIFASSLCCCCF